MDLISVSKAMRDLLQEAELAARFDVRVLIAGEPGVGKEHLARLIHRRGVRQRAPFEVVDCAGLTEVHLQGRLAGEEIGTVLFKETEQLTDPVQSLLMRLLDASDSDDRKGRSGSRDVQIMCSSGPSLYGDHVGETFLADLYYRLNTMCLIIPPLRERPEDVDPLLRHFIARSAERRQIPCPAFRQEWATTLEGYDWPGNVSELKNVAEAIVAGSREPRPLLRGRHAGPEHSRRGRFR